MIEPVLVKWSIPEEGFVKLNVDGSRSDKENLTYGEAFFEMLKASD